MKKEKGAVRLILAAAEFSSLTYSQLTKTWHRALAAVLGCPSWWLPYPPPLFPRHRNARSVPASPTPKISAATRLDATETSKTTPQAKRKDGWVLAEHSLVCCWVKHLQHIGQQQTQPSVFYVSAAWKCPASNSRATKTPNKDITRVHWPPSTHWIELGSLKSGREFRESQALVYAVGEFGCIGYI